MQKTNSQPYIEISNIKASNNKLVAKLDFSENISKFFLTDKFVAQYDENMEDIDEGILVIPPISAVIPIAWATGADVYVETLDKYYLDSLNKIEQVFHDWFPQFSFSGKIHVQNVISNKFNNKGYALLFSGGVDSLTSYIRNKDKQPTLISIWGADIPLNEYKFWNKVRSRLLNFTDEEGVNIQFIKTNIQEIPNNSLLTSEYRVEGWWGSVSHGLILLGLCAPLTTEKIGTIFSASPGKGINDATNILVNSSISWADVKIIHDGSELSRQEKIKILKHNPHCLSYLRVCWSQHQEYNCGYCEKCLRTIVGLILENIDPKVCNFNIKNNILNLVRINLTKGILNLTDNEIFMWQDIQKHISETIVDSEVSRKYKSEKFFRWFKNFDFLNYKYNMKEDLQIYVATKGGCEDFLDIDILFYGGFKGYWNFGDVIQLESNLLRARASCHDPEPKFAICVDANVIFSKRDVDYFLRRFNITHLIMLGTDCGKSSGLIPINDLKVKTKIFHIYGGGFLNEYWGESTIAEIKILKQVFQPEELFFTGQQISEKFIRKFSNEIKSLRPKFFGCRDVKSFEYAKREGIESVLTGDDAIDFIAALVDTSVDMSVSNPMHTEPNILLHINLSLYALDTRHEMPLLEKINKYRRYIRNHEDFHITWLQGYLEDRPEVCDTICALYKHQLMNSSMYGKIIDLGVAAATCRYREATTCLRRTHYASALVSSYHTAMLLMALGIPVELYKSNEYYDQKICGLFGEDLERTRVDTQELHSCWLNLLSIRKNWLMSELNPYISSDLISLNTIDNFDNYLKTIKSNLSSALDLIFSNPTRLRNRSTVPISDLLFQKEQTEKWWREAEELRRQLSSLGTILIIPYRWIRKQLTKFMYKAELKK
jgi:aerobic-type carbon monoxide dehydrogenase small subunit (CoxS/CutS family)